MPTKNLFWISVFLVLFSISCIKEETPPGDKCDQNVYLPGMDTKMKVFVEVINNDGNQVKHLPVKVVVEKIPCGLDYVSATESFNGETNTIGGYFICECNSMEVRNKYDDFIITATLTDENMSKEELVWFRKDYDGEPKKITITFRIFSD